MISIFRADTKMSRRKQVAILFGGVSPEHDVSILTGVQAFYALDQSRYDALPIYIDMQGVWWFGVDLIKHHTQLLKMNLSDVAKSVSLVHGGFNHANGAFIPADVCLIALHGGLGENGGVQSLCEMHRMPYTGMRRLGAAIAMDKWSTKQILSRLGVPVLPSHRLRKPRSGNFYSLADLEALNLRFPVCVKPCSLGSSIGVGFANDLETVQAILLNLFEQDEYVLLEPAIEKMQEFNLSVASNGEGGYWLSALESPIIDDWLDFKTKYCRNAGQKKMAPTGLIQLSRVFDPEMPESILLEIKKSAQIALDALGGAGMPRIDFIYDKATGEIWLNEVNPTPGSFGYYLWAAHNQQHGFVWVLNHLIDEALAHADLCMLDLEDAVPEEARMFERNKS